MTCSKLYQFKRSEEIDHQEKGICANTFFFFLVSTHCRIAQQITNNGLVFFRTNSRQRDQQGCGLVSTICGQNGSMVSKQIYSHYCLIHPRIFSPLIWRSVDGSAKCPKMTFGGPCAISDLEDSSCGKVIHECTITLTRPRNFTR